LILKEGQVLANGNKEQVVNGDTLSTAFDIPIKVTWQSGRPWIYVVKSAETNDFSGM